MAAFEAYQFITGTYLTNSSVTADPSGNGYTTGGLVKDPSGDGYQFTALPYSTPSVVSQTAPPMVAVTWDTGELPANTNTVIVYRTVDGVETTVRNGYNLYAVGGAIVDDWEAPIGVPVTYRAECFNSVGTDLGSTASSVAVTILADTVGTAWLSDPLDETSPVKVTMAGQAGQAPSRPIPGQVYQVGLRTIVLAGVPGLISNLDMGFYTQTTADRETVLALVKKANGLLLLRTPPPMMVPRLLYCFCPGMTPSEFRLTQGVEKIAWANPVTEVSPTTASTSVSSVSWQTYIDAFPTWADMEAAYATWFDAMKTPPV
jgi:hypothetical protein